VVQAFNQLLLVLDKVVLEVYKDVQVLRVQLVLEHKVCKVLQDQWVLVAEHKEQKVHKEQLVARAHLVFKVLQVLEHRD
jgi:hypothetical protein